MIASYGLTDRGCERAENEDRILLDDRLGLFIVADGMGGHTHGEVAAELAVTTVRCYIDSSRDRVDVTWPFGYNFDLSLCENRLATAVQLANRQVWRRSEQAPECAGMGTTLVAALLNGNTAAVANVGDSRLYLFRQERLIQLTIDDTWVGAMVQQGTLDPSEVANHPMRNVLTQAAGARENVEIHCVEHTFAAGDILLLSSDGLHSVVEEEAISAVLASGEGLERATSRLIHAARANGAPDNVSCVLLRYGGETELSR